MKTTITKIFALILTAAICASFAACNQSEQDTDSSDNVSDSPLVNVADGDEQEAEGGTDDESSTDDENGADENSEGNDAENNDDSEQASEDTDTDASEEDDTTASEENKSPDEESDSDSANEDGSGAPEKEEETAVITTDEEQQPASSGKGDAIAKTAESAVGYDYLYGGKSPEDGGFDNSGLVYYALTANGVACPRTTVEIMKIDSEVSYDELRRGDVVIFKMDDGSDIVFSGVYIGNGQAVMSFSEGIPVKIVDVATNYYRSAFVKGVRAAE